ncbi:MAG: YgjV family protein [Clostridia bacterium]|nr:YgjV family protein [Clostridia bacterium]
MFFDIFVQGLGWIAVACTIIALQFNTHFKIMLFKTLSELLFAVQLLFLGSITGMAMNFVGILRNIIFVYAVKKNKNVTPWIIVFMLITLATGITTAVLSWNVALSAMDKIFNNGAIIMISAIIVSVLPILAKTLTTIAYALKDPHKLRMLNLPSLIFWLIHDLFYLTFAGMFNNVFGLCSLAIAEIRFRKSKTDNKNSNEKNGSETN